MKDIGVKRYGRPGFQSVLDTLRRKNCNRARVIFKKLKSLTVVLEKANNEEDGCFDF